MFIIGLFSGFAAGFLTATYRIAQSRYNRRANKRQIGFTNVRG